MAKGTKTVIGLTLAIIGIAAINVAIRASARAPQDPDPGQEPGGLVTTYDNGSGNAMARRMAEPAPVAAHLVRSAIFQEMAAESIDNQIMVTGSVDVTEASPAHRYAWLLRVYANDARKRLLKEHHYLDQVFSIPGGRGTMSPSFADIFEMPAGSYKVELTLYAAPPALRLQDWKFGEDIKPKVSLKVSFFRKVVVLR